MFDWQVLIHYTVWSFYGADCVRNWIIHFIGYVRTILPPSLLILTLNIELIRIECFQLKNINADQIFWCVLKAGASFLLIIPFQRYFLLYQTLSGVINCRQFETPPPPPPPLSRQIDLGCPPKTKTDIHIKLQTKFCTFIRLVPIWPRFGSNSPDYIVVC